MNTKCGTLSEANVTDIVEDNKDLLDKLKELGITEDGDKLKVALSYYELMTKEEYKAMMKKFTKEWGKKNKKRLLKKAKMFIKLSKVEGEYIFCATDSVCDNCYSYLQKRRGENTFQPFGLLLVQPVSHLS